jgi:hypothetical protein
MYYLCVSVSFGLYLGSLYDDPFDDVGIGLFGDHVIQDGQRVATTPLRHGQYRDAHTLASFNGFVAQLC